MLNISGKNDFINDFKQLKIVPVAISYEYEPCDIEKVRELYNKKQDRNFKKTQIDDLTSMGKGIEKQKGAVHYSFAKPLDLELDILNDLKRRNDKLKKLAEIIDTKIYQMYKLQANNYIAANELLETDKYNKGFSNQQKQNFDNYLEECLSNIDGEKTELKKMFLEIYGNPVKNSEQ